MTSIDAAAAEEDANDSDDSLTAEKTNGTDSDYTISASLSDERKEVLLAALSLEGQISYTWGGKATTTGWNTSWSSGGGLDCSGFVQWSYWTGIGIRSGLGSTAQISYSYKKINESELQPGDLGLLFKGGSGYEAENGKIYETEAEATEKNLKLAAKSVNRQLNGKEKITTGAVRKAKKAAQAYETACENAGGKELTQAKKYEKKAKAAREEAAELIAKAENYEAQAAKYLNSVSAKSVTALSLQTFAAVTDDSTTEESDAPVSAQSVTALSLQTFAAVTDDSTTEESDAPVSAQSVTALSLQTFAAVTDDSTTEEDDSSTSGSSDGSAQEDAGTADSGSSSGSTSSGSTSSDSTSSGSTSSDDTSSDDTASGDTSSANSASGSASGSSDTDDSGSSSDGSTSSNASAKAAKLTAKAESLQAEAKSLKSKAAAWQKKAKALRKTAKSKKSAASVKLSKLKKKASIAKSEAVVAVADSYEISLEANHVGIYVGTDDNGNQLWVHCNSTKDTVSVDSVSYFTYFVRVIDEEHYTTVDEGDLTVSDAKKRGKAQRLIEKMIAEHALYKVVLEKFKEEEPPTAYAEQQTAAIQIYADEQNA